MGRRLAVWSLAVLALAPAAAAATSGPVFGLRGLGNPKLGYFVYPLAPGAERSGAVIVSNTGTAAGTVTLFTADATTGQTSGTVYQTDTKPVAAGSWITLSATSFRLVPGAHRRVDFVVHVPAGTKPGQWVGGIVAETSHITPSPKTKQKTSVQIRIRDLTIIAVQVNVPGPLAAAFSVGKVTTGGQRGFQQVIVHVANTGNALAKPSGKVVITTAGGAVVETLTFTMDTFLPHTAIDYPILLRKALGAGDYHAAVTLSYPSPAGGAKTISAHPAFSVSRQNVAQVFTSASPTKPAPPGTPASSSGSSSRWLIIGVAAAAGIVLLLAALLLPGVLRRRRPARQAAPAAPSSPAPAPAAVAPASTAPALVAPATNGLSGAAAACAGSHDWRVAYDSGQLGADGVWRFPHRCRACGLELIATDVSDASAQAAHLR